MACREFPHAENILEISGIGENILSGILTEMGDISRFDDGKEIQKLSGLGLAASLKKMQSLIVIACKPLRIIYTILTKGTVYDPKKMLMDIRRPAKQEAVAA